MLPCIPGLCQSFDNYILNEENKLIRYDYYTHSIRRRLLYEKLQGIAPEGFPGIETDNYSVIYRIPLRDRGVKFGRKSEKTSK
jgi:hypothetical protein